MMEDMNACEERHIDRIEDDDMKPNVSDTTIAPLNSRNNLNENLDQFTEGDGSIATTVSSAELSKRKGKSDSIMADISFQTSQFSSSHSNREFKGISLLEPENGHQQNQVSLTKKTSINESGKDDPIQTVHVPSPGRQKKDHVSEIVDLEAGIFVRNINFSKGVVDDSERDDSEQMNNDTGQISVCSAPRSKRKIILFKRVNSFGTNERVDNEQFSTKIEIETDLSDENLIAQLRGYCDLALNNDMKQKKNGSSSSFHNHRNSHGEDEVEYANREGSRDDDISEHDDSSAFNIRHEGPFECWVCLSKFTKCLDVKKHIIQNHSQGLCACAQWVNEKDELQTQLFLFCPNQCNYVSSRLDEFSYHYMVSCQNPAEIFLGRNMVEVQRDFISNEYFQLKKQIALRASPNKFKSQECLLDLSNAGGTEEINSCVRSDDQNMTGSFYEEQRGKECDNTNPRRLMKEIDQSTETVSTSHHKLMAMKLDKNDVYECDSCLLVFATNQLLESHKKNCSAEKIHGGAVNKSMEVREKSIICFECGKDFSDNESLEMHMKEHVKEMSVRCNEYWMSNYQRFGYLQYAQNHVVEKPAAVNYNEHEETYGNDGGPGIEYEKTISPKAMPWVRKPFKCTECGKSFNVRSHLVCHMKIHDGGDISFKCDECALVFKNKYALQRHISGVHSEERPYKCTKCSKTYKYESNLHGHMKIHNKAKSFSCKLCVKSFRLKGQLLYHMKIHSDESTEKHGDDGSRDIKREKQNEEMPFTCDECGMTFGTEESLVEHLKEHGEELKTFDCIKCGKCFNQKRLLDCHMKIHNGESRFKCDECGLVFTDSYSLRKHNMGKHSGIKHFKCTECSKSYRYKASLREHLKMHSGNLTCKCNVCGQSFRWKKYLKLHLRIHRGNNAFDCQKCDESFNSNEDLLKHQILHVTEEDPLRCSGCDKTFLSEKILKRHMKMHREKRYKCDVCGKGFHQKTLFEDHVRIHNEEDPFKCYLCNETFKNRYYLSRHVKQHGEKPYLCNECGKTFRIRSRLTHHMKSHLGEKPHSCTVCDFRCLDKGNLKKHMLKHTGEKPFKCKICGVSLKDGSTHMKRHLKEREFQCTECGAKFWDKFHLKSHMRTHTGEKPFQCSECGNRYRDNSSLRIHMMRHRGEKPHKCPFCNKGFVDRTHLTSHIRVHTGEKPYKCDFCDMRFNQNVSRRMHMKKHTDEERRSKMSYYY